MAENPGKPAEPESARVHFPSNSANVALVDPTSPFTIGDRVEILPGVLRNLTGRTGSVLGHIAQPKGVAIAMDDKKGIYPSRWQATNGNTLTVYALSIPPAHLKVLSHSS